MLRLKIWLVNMFFWGIASTYAQVPQHDKMWIQGSAEIIKMYFEEDSVKKEYHLDTTWDGGMIQYHAAGHSNICDSSGEFQFSFDGGDIITREHKIMEGGYKMVPEGFYKRYNGFGCYSQSSIILPLHGKKYMVLIATTSDAQMEAWYRATNNDSAFFDLLLYGIVDMEANGGLGRVESRQVITDKGYMGLTNMMACRHANGRDWWLLKRVHYQNCFYTYLITADAEVIDYGKQWFPLIAKGYDWDSDGQCMFNADGTQFASVVGHRGTVNLFDFDRCTGQLSNQQIIHVPERSVHTPQDTADWEFMTTVGVCFSPNGRFLYVGNKFNIQQYDLWDSDSASAWYHVAKLDTTWEVFQGYSNICSAPNGKLYVGNWAGLSKQMSRIDNPNAKGAACGFCPRCERYNTAWGSATRPPSMPNYRLGALPGSPCDTLKSPVPAFGLEAIVPNAFSPNADGKNDTWHILNVAALQAAGCQFLGVSVYNRWGNEVFNSQDINFSWDGAAWASDTYHYYIRYRTPQAEQKIQKGSVLVVR
ncbi:MAG: gliding motility-associated C-terminal domain-containing protein [Chitinophagaceae bacterium]|nr:gliding motility-associated C-terminal domain-containing protein [Chitinophagaceae bacterium]